MQKESDAGLISWVSLASKASLCAKSSQTTPASQEALRCSVCYYSNSQEKNITLAKSNLTH